MDTAQNCCYLTAIPTFSAKPGKYSVPTTVKITDSARGAIIYYRTDGWTPTSDSARYMDPITPSSTTTLRAIVSSPYAGRSLVAVAEYKMNTPAGGSAGLQASADVAPPAEQPVISRQVVVPQGTIVHPVFDRHLASKTAKVGGKIPFVLDRNVMLNGIVAAPKDPPATGIVIQVDRAGAGNGAIFC